MSKTIKTIISILIAAVYMQLGTFAQTKNTASEVKDYREVDGKIIIELIVNGEKGDFLLDLAGHNAILSEYMDKFHIDTTQKGDFRYDAFLYKQVQPVGSVLINSITFGNNVFGNGVSAFVLGDEPYLRKLGVVGVVNGTLFRNVVLTIDSRRKKITTSVPYRPPYMKLDHRKDLNILAGSAVTFPIIIDGMTIPLVFDTWNDNMFTFTSTDFAKVAGEISGTTFLSEGYALPATTGRTKNIAQFEFVKSNFSKVVAVENPNLKHSLVGTAILKEGILSIDYQKQKVYFQPYDLVVVNDEVIVNPTISVEPGKLNAITRDYFIEHIYNYRGNKEFVFKGDKPVVIDFWATWCGPCMRLIPQMEQLAEKYKGRVLFLKVNADKEKELCSVFNINALPTLFFIPVGGKPIIEVGATPEKFVQIIEEQLLR